MVSTETIRALAPHWVAMFLLMLLLLRAVEAVLGRPSIWASFALILAVALAYPAAVRALGVAPEPWRR